MACTGSAAAGGARCTFSSRPAPRRIPASVLGRAADHDYRALIIASEPIDGTAWPEIPQRSTFEVTPDLRLRIEPLDES
jgi:hypothetical protein